MEEMKKRVKDRWTLKNVYQNLRGSKRAKADEGSQTGHKFSVFSASDIYRRRGKQLRESIED